MSTHLDGLLCGESLNARPLSSLGGCGVPEREGHRKIVSIEDSRVPDVRVRAEPIPSHEVDETAGARISAGLGSRALDDLNLEGQASLGVGVLPASQRGA